MIGFIKKGMWEADLDSMGFWKRLGVQALRFFTITFTGFSQHRCSLHAAGLTYFSLMALVPVMCLLLLLARVCGAGDFARDKINGTIDSLICDFEKGPDDLPEFFVKNQPPEQIESRRQMAHDLAVQARTISNGLFERIEQFDVRTMGLVGVLMLLWTAVSTLGMVEHAFNEVWEVPKARPLWKKFLLYALVSLVLPMLIALALSMPILRLVRLALDATLGATSYTKWAGDAVIWVLDSRLFGWSISLLFAVAAFTFILTFMPNRKVSFRSSVEGGLVTALLFGGWLKLCAVAQVGIAKSSAMYGSFAFLPIVLAWIYMSWQIILLGSNMTYAFQCVHLRVRPDSGG